MYDFEPLIFKANDIPKKFRMEKIFLNQYLINGELKEWNGKFQKVLSPIYIDDNSGIRPKEIGENTLCLAKTLP